MLWTYGAAGEASVVDRSSFGPVCLGSVGFGRTKVVLPGDQVIFDFERFSLVMIIFFCFWAFLVGPSTRNGNYSSIYGNV